MPRIHAPSVVEHVAQQRAAVFDAAIDLFVEHGYAAVNVGDIAERVGIARNSLYRYFPDKAHILAAWFEQVMDPLIAASEAAARRVEPASERLRRWVKLQLEFLFDPRHDVMVQAATTTPDLPAALRARFGERHRDLYATLGQVLIDGGLAPVIAERRSLLIAGLIRSGADLRRRGTGRSTVIADVTTAALAVAALPVA